MVGKLLGFGKGMGEPGELRYLGLSERITDWLNQLIVEFLRRERAGQLDWPEEIKNFAANFIEVPDTADFVGKEFFKRPEVREIFRRHFVTEAEYEELLRIVEEHTEPAREKLSAAESALEAKVFEKDITPFFDQYEAKVAAQPNAPERLEKLRRIKQQLVEVFYKNFNKAFQRGLVLRDAYNNASKGVYEFFDRSLSTESLELGGQAMEISSKFYIELKDLLKRLKDKYPK